MTGSLDREEALEADPLQDGHHVGEAGAAQQTDIPFGGERLAVALDHAEQKIEAPWLEVREHTPA